MKSTKKIMLTAGMLFQLSASVYADNWSDAVAAFGGADVVFNNRGTLAWSTALKKAKELGTPEAMSIGLYQAEGNPNVLANKFPGAMRDNVVESVLQNIVNQNAPTRTVSESNNAAPVNAAPVNAAPVNAAPANAAPVNTQTSTGSSWFPNFGGSSTTNTQSTANAQAAIDAQIAKIQAAAEAQIAAIRVQQEANIKTAMQTQQHEDAARAAAQQQALTNIVNSGATGASLYNSYIDLIMNSLQQALSSIADANVKQQVVSYAQNKLANMKASASVNSDPSHALGRMSSKKAVKKNKNSRSHATR